MKEKLQRAFKWCKKYPAGAIIVLAGLIVLGGFLCSCSESGSSELPKPKDVAGIYVIESGFQHMVDNSGADTTTEFTTEDNIQLQAMQSGSAVDLYVCLGTVDKDGKMLCDYREELDFYGAKGCQFVKGSVEFKDDKAVLKVVIEASYPDYDFEGTNTVEIVLARVGEACEE